MAKLEPGIQVCQSERILSLARRHRTTQLGEDDARAALATCLTSAVRRWRKWLDLSLQPGQEFWISNFYARSSARERIDEIFGDNILPGARIELHDGLWRPIDIAECLPRDWSGTCDFACCTSTYLSEVMKCHHTSAMFRADSRLLRPDKLIPAMRCVLEKVCSGTHDYMTAAYEVDAKYGGSK
jgi:hypothetical protein